MGRRQQWVYHVEPSQFPPDFPERLERFREAAGLSWRGLARLLRMRARNVWRWRSGTQPDAGHLYALFSLAAEMGLLHHLLPTVAGSEAVSSVSGTNREEPCGVWRGRERYLGFTPGGRILIQLMTLQKAPNVAYPGRTAVPTTAPTSVRHASQSQVEGTRLYRSPHTSLPRHNADGDAGS